MRKPKDVSKSQEERYYVRTVERALSILKIFIENEEIGEYSLVDISRITHLSQSTAYRLLVTLRCAGFMDQDPISGKYRLGTSALALGDAFLRQNNLFQKAKPSLISLRDKTGETIHLAVLDETEVVYLEKLAGLHPIGLMSSRVGGRAPVHCTGLGKALLAFLPQQHTDSILQNTSLSKFTDNTITDLDALMKELIEIQKNGYAVDNEEHNKGVTCIASPIFDHNGVVAAISASGPNDRMLNDPKLIDMVKSSALEITNLLGGNLIKALNN